MRSVVLRICVPIFMLFAIADFTSAGPIVCGSASPYLDPGLWPFVGYQVGAWTTLVDYLIVIAGLWSLGVILKNYSSFKKARLQWRLCVPNMLLAARHGSVEEAINIAGEYPKSHVAPVFAAILQTVRSSRAGRQSDQNAKKAARCALRNRRVVLSEGIWSVKAMTRVAPMLGLIRACLY